MFIISFSFKKEITIHRKFLRIMITFLPEKLNFRLTMKFPEMFIHHLNR